MPRRKQRRPNLDMTQPYMMDLHKLNSPKIYLLGPKKKKRIV